MTTTRTLDAALAIAALAVPAAQAQPADNTPLAPAAAHAQIEQDPPADVHAPLARVPAASARPQDMRHLRAGNAHVGAYPPGTTPAASRPQPTPSERSRSC